MEYVTVLSYELLALFLFGLHHGDFSVSHFIAFGVAPKLRMVGVHVGSRVYFNKFLLSELEVSVRVFKVLTDLATL